jgi:adenosine deaminase
MPRKKPLPLDVTDDRPVLMKALETLYIVYQKVPCDTYTPERTQNGWTVCRHCGESETTHEVLTAVRTVLAAWGDNK